MHEIWSWTYIMYIVIHFSDIRIYRLLILGYFADCKMFENNPNFCYVFPIYNSKLHDICSTSNFVHPPFKEFGEISCILPLKCVWRILAETKELHLVFHSSWLTYNKGFTVKLSTLVYKWIILKQWTRIASSIVVHANIISYIENNRQ